MKKYKFKKVKWEWDNFACKSYNIVAKFEETLINLGIMEDFSDIEDTEKFVEKNYKDFDAIKDTDYEPTGARNNRSSEYSDSWFTGVDYSTFGQSGRSGDDS